MEDGAISMMAPTIPAAVATMIAAAISSRWPGGAVVMSSAPHRSDFRITQRGWPPLRPFVGAARSKPACSKRSTVPT